MSFGFGLAFTKIRSVLSAALDLVFTNTQVLDPRITFTRGSSGTYFGSDGLLKSAVVNEPRFEYDPYTLQPRGLLIEEQRTNALLNSLLSGTSLSTQPVVVTALPWTLSFYGTGTVTLSGAYTGSLVGTGANDRVALTFTPTVGVVGCTVTGQVKWAQMELGSFATSFIPTAGSTATRAADSAKMVGTDFSSWFTQSTAGTLVSEVVYDAAPITVQYGAMISDGTGANRIYNRRNITGYNDQSVVAGGAFGTVAVPNVNLYGVVAKQAVAYQTTVAGPSNYAANGVLGTQSNQPVAISPSQLELGMGLGGTHLNGHIRSIKYYNTRLPNATLQSLTS